MKTTMLVLVTCVAVAGCGDPPWVGTYTAKGTWELSGPLSGGRTVGDAVADLLQDEVVSMSKAPDFLADDLNDWLADHIREPIKSTVDKSVPSDLAPDGDVTKLLAAALAQVTLESTIKLGGDEDELEGKETFTAIEYLVDGKPHRLAVSDYCKEACESIEAKWAGKEDGDGVLEIDPHSVAIRYGELVRLVATDLLEASKLASLTSQVSSAVQCTTIVAAILDGEAGYEISLVGWSHTFDQAELVELCNSAMSLFEERVLGQFELDSHVEVGGHVNWTKADGVVQLQSDADFGGIINVLPRAIAPKLSVAFTGQQE